MKRVKVIRRADQDAPQKTGGMRNVRNLTPDGEKGIEMFYRVDYIVAVMLAGFGLGALLSRPTAGVSSSRLARGYYIVAVVLSVLRTGVYLETILGSQTKVWSTVGGCIGDLLGLTFGALFGLAIRRRDARNFLPGSSILDGKCVALAFSFALAGIGKAFAMAPMTEFFVQSGYSVTFLKFIIIAEVFGAIGMLIPWAVIPALAGLGVDMFGAVLTHVHNGDPVNDSTGAIGSLINIVLIGSLFALRRKDGSTLPTLCGAFLRTAGGAVACLLIAMIGSAAVQHYGPPTKVAPPALSNSR
jgi:DoxX-like family